MQYVDEGGETATRGAGTDSRFRRICPGLVGARKLPIPEKVAGPEIADFRL